MTGEVAQSGDGDSKGYATLTVFVWAGAIIVNAAFVALVAWGALKSWVFGFVASIIYTTSLFWQAFQLRRTQSSEHNNGNTVLTSVLFFLAVVAIGITTFIPIVNIIGYCIPILPSTVHVTPMINRTGLSVKVANWVEFGISSTPHASSMYFPRSQTAIFVDFEGNSSSSASALWRVNSGGSTPEFILSSVIPINLISVSNGTLACFKAQSSDVAWVHIACTEGRGMNKTIPLEGLYGDLLSENELVWFKANDTLVYSVNPKEGLSKFQLHEGIFPNGDDSNTSGDQNQCNARFFPVGLLLASIIPVLVASVLLQVKHEVASMPLAEYIAITCMLLAIALIVNPAFSGVLEILRWWLPFSSLFWHLWNTFGYLTNRIKPSTLSWSTNFAGIVFFVGMNRLLDVPFGQNNVWWRWVVITIAAYLPLIALSTILGASLLMVLGAVGLLFDVYRLVSVLTALFPDAIKIPISFIVLALAGIGLAVFGFLLSKHQAKFSETVTNWSTRNLSRWMMIQHPQPTHLSISDDTVEIETGVDVVTSDERVILS